MPDTEFDPREYRTAIKVPLAQFGAVALLVWALYGLRLAGIDVLGLMAHRESAEPVPQLAYLATAASITVFAAPLLLLQLRKNRILLKHGMRLEARFVSRSPLRKNDIVPVTFTYTVNGVEYTQRRDVAAVLADDYDQNTRVRVIVDPANPRKCLLSPIPLS